MMRGSRHEVGFGYQGFVKESGGTMQVRARRNLIRREGKWNIGRGVLHPINVWQDQWKDWL